MGQSAEDKAKARAIVAGWTWQQAEGHNFGFKYSTRTLTRFYESASMQPDEMKLVIEYLREEEIGQAGISLMNRCVDLGTGWKAKDAWYQTSPGDKWANTESTRVRVYQVLFQPSAESPDGDGPYTVENGCQYRIKHTFYWEVEELPNLPPSTSGCESTMQGITRDRETGLFSCVIETKERIQQDVEEYVTGQTAFETTKEEQHIGVRQSNVSGTGRQAKVNRGTIVTRKLSKNPDCTSNVENTVRVEKPVLDAVVEFSRTLRGTVERRVNRSQMQAVNASGLRVGEVRRSDKTEGELWNNEIRVTTADPAGLIAQGCSRNIGTHTDQETENVARKPNVEQESPGINVEIRKEARRTEDDTWDVSTTRIVFSPRTTGKITHGSSTVSTDTTIGVDQPMPPSSGRGGVNVVRRVSATPNDHGSYSTSEEVVTYTPVSKRIVSGSVTATETTVEGINQVTVPAGGPEVNKSVNVSIGMNDHGSMTTRKSTVVYHPKTETATCGTASQTETIVTGINQTSVQSDTGGTNRRTDVSVSINDHGSMTTQKRTITYHPQTRSATYGTTSQTETIVSGINQSTVQSGKGGTNSRTDVSFSINDHGSMTTQKRTITYHPQTRSATCGTTSQTETIVSGINQSTVQSGTGGRNKRTDVSFSMNDHGSMTTQRRTITYHPLTRSLRWSDENFTYSAKAYKNASSPITPALSDYSGASFSINDHGTYDGYVTTRKQRKNLVSSGTLAYEYTTEVKSKVYHMKRGKLYALELKAECTRFFGSVRTVMKKTSGGESYPTAGWVSKCECINESMAKGIAFKNISVESDLEVVIPNATSQS